MATIVGGRRRLDRQNSSLMFRQITPPHGWKEDSDSYYLRLTLPGFEAKDITIHMNKYGQLVVRGDKQVTEHKYITFEETFEVPNDADLEEASGMFEDGQIYCVTIPKKQQVEHAITVANEENKPKPHGNKDGSFHKYDSTKKPEELLPQQRGRISASNSLKIVTGDKSKQKLYFAFSIATVIALLVLAVVLIVKFRRHHH
ncbi:hypothetical protein Salat_1493800 [Sesamum alatum]|uniref:SHSP domain-containing protein n=1 Tax=Sesamum alatum TaxID=300844 RepID=A0AAE2CMF0_9LAMI|nr:hypothetical protein Salat_1493800 [Sesamum alatum]